MVKDTQELVTCLVNHLVTKMIIEGERPSGQGWKLRYDKKGCEMAAWCTWLTIVMSATQKIYYGPFLDVSRVPLLGSEFPRVVLHTHGSWVVLQICPLGFHTSNPNS
jgi:hypothetical protein